MTINNGGRSRYAMEVRERGLTPNTSCSGTTDPVSNITSRLAGSPSDRASDDVARGEGNGDNTKSDDVEFHFRVINVKSVSV
jgi:hypothetical protein